ncbi:MAG: hypothetical protein EA375_04665 [Acholeplasmataceae bacterium]|nr:MAG: hypothetical protein EA375_04665 [Acholeplasmataceae bacterium]
MDFVTQAVIRGTAHFTTTHFTGTLGLGGTAVVDGGVWPGRLTQSEHFNLQHDLTIEGDLRLNAGTFEVSGHDVVVTGDLDLDSGTLDLGAGGLDVHGDAAMRTGHLTVGGGTVSISGDFTTGNSSGRIRMEHEDDHLLVKGNFQTQTLNTLTAGTLEVRGDFTQIRNTIYSNATYTYNPSGTHLTRLSGDSVQNISFSHPNNSYFWDLEIDNDNGIQLNTRAFVRNHIHFKTDVVLNVENLHPMGNATIDGQTWPFDLHINQIWVLQHDVVVRGEIHDPHGLIDLNGFTLKRAFSIIYDDNDSTGGTVVQDSNRWYVEDSLVTVLHNEGNLEKENHIFIGWNTEPDGNGITYLPDDTFTIEQNTNLYALWIRVYEVIFEDHDGTLLKIETVIHGHAAHPPADPIREGYTFMAWDRAYDDIITDLVVTATYQINLYTVTFKDDDDTVLKEEDVSHGSGATAPSDPVKTGHTFMGWDAVFEHVTEPLVITATYQVNTYDLVYEGHDGTMLSSLVIEYGADLTMMDTPSGPLRTGYTFTGWSEELPDTMPDHHLVLIAQYTINSYTITFETHGGSMVSPITEHYGTAIIEPAFPVKTGHTFIGWFSDQDLIENYLFDTMPAEHVTLYAKWEVNQYTITFDTRGGSSIDVITLDYQEPVMAPVHPTKEGFRFNGWHMPLPETMPAENLVLQATWLKIDMSSDDVVIRDVSGLEDAIDEELIAGRNVDIHISITLHDEETVNNSDMIIIDAFIEGQAAMNNTRIVYLDISLFLIQEGFDPEQLTSTSQPVIITIEIPEAHRGFINYAILRAHDGVVDLLETNHDEANHTLTFTTDRFSTYTIIYEVPSTGLSPWWFVPMALIPAGIMGFLFRDQLANMIKRTLKRIKKQQQSAS